METIERDVAWATAAHQALVDAVTQHLSESTLQLAAPSRLPDWTRGHVLAHVINSGDGHIGILDAAARGEVRAQYPHGPDGRAADIEAGAVQPATELLGRLRVSNEQLEQRWATSNWEGKGVAPNSGEIAVRDLPFARIREVSIHHIDLDIGYEFDDLPGEYVRRELRLMEMRWKAKQPMGRSSLPDIARELAPPKRLAWMLGRIDVDGLAPASVF